MNSNFEQNEANFPQNGPQGPNGSPQYSPNPNNNSGDMGRLKKAQSKLNIANVCAAVSFLFGGVLLSSIGLGFALYGRNQLKACSDVQPQYKPILERLLKVSKITLGLCIAALVINAVTAIYMYPVILETVQSGNLPSIFGMGGSTSTTTSIWG